MVEGERLAVVRARALQKLAPRLAMPASARANSPTVSVIVPLFNKRDYIADTLASIASSTWRDLEIIVVDDFCSDGSVAVVEAMAGTDSRIRLLRHNCNRGLSAARNTGLAAARGRIIQFWDADDVLDPQWLARAIPIMDEDAADIVTGVALRDGEVLPLYASSKRLCRRTAFQVEPEIFATSSVWSKLYSRSFLDRHGLQFVDGLYMQDTEFNLRAFPLSTTVSMTPYAVGEYRYTADSASSQFNRARMDDCFKVDRLTKEFHVARGWQHWMYFRDYKVLRFVFNFFLVQLIDQKFPARTGEEQRPSAVPASLVDDYLEHFGRAIAAMPEGLAYLRNVDDRRARAFTAVAEGKTHLFWPLMRGKRA